MRSTRLAAALVALAPFTALANGLAAQGPAITTIDPTSAEHPQPVTITGLGFDATSSVMIDGVPATVLAFSPTQLDVQPAPGAPGFLDVFVTNAGGGTTASEFATRWPALRATESGPGGMLDLALENGEAGQVVYAFGFGLLPAPVAIDPAIHHGVLLDPLAAFGILATAAVPPSGSHALSFAIGPDPSTLGLAVHLQAFASQGTPPHDLAFSNAATVIIGGSVPPSGLVYPVDPMALTIGVPAAPNTPAVMGAVTQWAVAPALPAGLTLDPSDGTIAGTPSAAATSASYTVTASNPAGSAQTTLAIEVLAPAFRIDHASHGFGQLLPHQVLDTTTAQLVDVTDLDALDAAISQGFPLQPQAVWPTGALLPDGSSGNHFVIVRFSEALNVDSVLDSSVSGAATNHLTGAITITALDPVTGAVSPVPGQPFVDGQTYGGSIAGANYVLEPWVVYDPTDVDADGILVETTTVAGGTPGLGFPGTESANFPLAGDLFGPETFVYVIDSDALLATHEAAPAGLTIRVAITTSVLAASGTALEEQGLIALTAGPDTLPPAVLTAAGLPMISPGNGDIDVDPETTIEVRFAESMDLATLGSPHGVPPLPSAAMSLTFGGPTMPIAMPFHVRPVSVFDLSHVVLTPAEPFPGLGPVLPGCANLDIVDVDVHAFGAKDLVGLDIGAPTQTSFTTGLGQGLVNAPIAPEAIYVGRADSLSIVDLNGFGGGTGDPTFNPLCPIGKDQTDFPNNPNVSLQGSSLIPPLGIGTCSIDGGSDGVMTLTEDSSLDARLLRGAVGSIDDMALGHSLDAVFNASLPFGCASGGGNLCATSGLQQFSPALAGPNTLMPADAFNPPLMTVFAAENPISWAPHPNPPPMAVPASCAAPLILGIEPTSIDNVAVNLMVPGPFPFGNPGACIPPSSILSAEQNAFFQGPSPPAVSLASCSTFAFRQQIGQFLYVVDRAAGEVLVLGSNRMNLLKRIALPDPTRLAMSPSLDYLAVTNQSAGTVSFLSTDPTAPTFHQVVKTTQVGLDPFGIAWESANEDILVCNEGDGTVSVISAFSLEVRKTVSSLLTAPFEVVTTPRQNGFGLNRNVYYAWILNRDGTLALFESGPDGINGWGYDDVIGAAPFTLANPTALQPDPRDLTGAVWVTHETPLDPVTGLPSGVAGAAATKVGLDATFHGIQPLNPVGTPNMRDLVFVLEHSLDATVLTGTATDLAFDNLRNFGSLTNLATAFSPGVPLTMNGKSLVKPIPGFGTFENVSEPEYLFLAVPNSSQGPGVVDVIDLATLTRLDTDPFQFGTQSIPAPGAAVLMDYFRQ